MSYLENARHGSNAWWRYGAAVVLALVLATVFTALLVVILQALHLVSADFAERIADSSRPVSFFGLNGMVFLMVLLGFAAAIRLVHGKRPSDVTGPWSGRGFAAGFVIWTAALIATGLVDFAIAPHGFRLSMSASTARLALAALGGLAVQTFTEEFVFRGYLTQALFLATKRTLPTAVVSGLLFGAVHIPNGAPQAVSATFFGVMLAVIAIRTGGISFTFGLHLANNLFGAVVIASSNDVFRGSPALITQDTPHLMWWDTGLGVLALAILVLGMDRFGRPPTGSRPGGRAATASS